MAVNDHITGLPEELFVAHEAMENGCTVSFPFGGKAKYDLLIERGGEILKIQVKTASIHGDLKQQIRGLDDYTETQVDYFAGVADLDEIDADEMPSIDEPRHIFYRRFENVNGKTARVNYKQPENIPTDHNRQEANFATEYDFNAMIEPQLPERD